MFMLIKFMKKIYDVLIKWLFYGYRNDINNEKDLNINTNSD